MATVKFTTVPSKRLAASISAAASSFQVNNILGWDGVALTSGDLGTKAYVVFRNDTNTLMEIMQIDPSTIANASITILARGLKFDGTLATEVTANKLAWVKNETIVELGADVPQLLEHTVRTVGDQTIADIKTFSSSPVVPTPSGNTDAANKAYVDGVVTGGAADANDTTKGLVERATQAEIEAGTGTGGTSAALFVTPSRLGAKLVAGYAADAGSNDTYAITLSPVPTQYSTGMEVAFKPNTANTGACTINVNSLGAKSIKVGGTVDPIDNDLQVGKIYKLIYDGTNFQLLNPSASGEVPVGSMSMYAGSAAPTGWLLCDASAVSRTTYAALFAVISTTYGTGDGSSTFNVPDMRGRVPAGVGTGTGGGSSGTGLPSGGSALTAVSRGTWKGAETHTLAESEIPAHTHAATGVSLGSNYSTASASVSTSTNAGTGNSTTPVSGSTGGGGSHNNIQPVMGVNFIIKY